MPSFTISPALTGFLVNVPAFPVNVTYFPVNVPVYPVKIPGFPVKVGFAQNLGKVCPVVEQKPGYLPVFPISIRGICRFH
jgi:hypothetical protein